MDADQGGSIGIDELEEPLIGLGIAATREEVNNMIEMIDDDGEIQFEEFLQIISNKNGLQSVSSSKITAFFKALSMGAINDGGSNQDLSFNVLVMNMRRKAMMDSFKEGKGPDAERDYGK